MEKPCCKGIVRSLEGLKGTESLLGDLPLYSTPPAQEKGKNHIVHDIYGFSIPNTKYIVDHLSSNGYVATMPDFYRGDPWTGEDSKSQAFADWFPKYVSPEYWEKFKVDIKNIAEHLKSQGCTKVVVIGFCWGGLATCIAAGTGLIDAGVSLHGAAHNAAQVNNSKCPLRFITVAVDPHFSAETQEELRNAFKAEGAVKGDVIVVEGMNHGFVVRGDFEGNPSQKAAADKAMRDTMEFIDAHTA